VRSVASTTSATATTTTFAEAGARSRDVMAPIDREHLITNIVAHASDRVSAEVQQRVIGYWTSVAADLGARVAAGLGRRERVRYGAR
jgi:catalase